MKGGIFRTLGEVVKMDSTIAAFIGAIIGGLIGGAGSYFGGKTGAKDNFQYLNRNERLIAAKKISMQLVHLRNMREALKIETNKDIIFNVASKLIKIENWLDVVAVLNFDKDISNKMMYMFEFFRTVENTAKDPQEFINQCKKEGKHKTLESVGEYIRLWFVDSKPNTDEIEEMIDNLIIELEPK